MDDRLRAVLIVASIAACTSADRPCLEAPAAEQAGLVVERAAGMSASDPCGSDEGIRARQRRW